MCALGHNMSGEECRAKTKAMRLQYRRTLEHNSTSGNDRTTCLYFRQLDEILHGEGMMTLRRIRNSLPLDTLPTPGRATGSVDGDVAPRQESFRLTLETEEEGTPPEVLVPETQDPLENQGTPGNDDDDDEIQVEEEAQAGPSQRSGSGGSPPPRRGSQEVAGECSWGGNRSGPPRASVPGGQKASRSDGGQRRASLHSPRCTSGSPAYGKGKGASPVRPGPMPMVPHPPQGPRENPGQGPVHPLDMGARRVQVSVPGVAIDQGPNVPLSLEDL
ncbi:UNVERIFIED_CONTAM: hypothetical protein K2H54_008499 [Gekko kuhli]